MGIHDLLNERDNNEDSQFSAATAVPGWLVPGDGFAFGEQTPQPYAGLPTHFAPKKEELDGYSKKHLDYLKSLNIFKVTKIYL